MDRLEILARAWTAGANVEGLDKTEAIRAIQNTEGFEACFGRGGWAACGQHDCAFREDCCQTLVTQDPCQVVVCEAPDGPAPAETD